MKLTQDAVLTFVKGLAGILTAVGVTVSPEDAVAIGVGFWAVYGVIQSFRGFMKSKNV